MIVNILVASFFVFYAYILPALNLILGSYKNFPLRFFHFLFTTLTLKIKLERIIRHERVIGFVLGKINDGPGRRRG